MHHTKNPVRAKQMGKKEPNLPENWDSISYDIMNDILHEKFSVPSLPKNTGAMRSIRFYLDTGHTINSTYCDRIINTICVIKRQNEK